MLGKIGILGVTAVIILLALLLHVTNPSTAGPLGILAVFILLYLLVLSVLTFLLSIGGRIIAKIASGVTTKKPFRPLSIKKAYYFSSIISLAPVMFIAMQSVGEVGVYDVALVALFVVIACVYISKRTL